MKQETIFLNGKIYTLDHNHTIVEGMLIKNGKIVALGKSEELIKMCGRIQKLSIWRAEQYFQALQTAMYTYLVPDMEQC